jgi:mxaJ protein
MNAPRLLLVGFAIALLGGVSSSVAGSGALRVCADPNNLPYSNNRLEGFENRLAALAARDLGFADVRYTWWAQRRGFLRNTLNASECDVVMGVPSTMDGVLTTPPYYRSTYTFVWRADRHLQPVSLDDPRMRQWRVGVPLVGDDGANPPPAHALSRRGIIRNVVGFTVYGNYSEENPTARIVSAVAAGDIDVALAWGPIAGYFASIATVPLVVRPIPQPSDVPALPFSFDISMAVRRDDATLRSRLDSFIVRRRSEIRSLLARYHIPNIDPLAEEAKP